MTDPIRQAYQQAARHAHSSILRHPPESMAATLRRLADRAETMDGPDYYGTGALIEDFEARMADLLGKPAALFLSSGSLAQPMALKIHADKQDKQVVGLHPTSHLVLHEQDGYQKLWGLKGRLIGNKQQVLSYDDLQKQSPGEFAAIVLELPMREIGGQLPAWDDLKAQINWARQHNIAVHIDGARLWHCPAYYQRSLAEIAALGDSVYVSLYKDIGGIAGAVLAGETEFINEARIWNRRAGGNLIALYPYILAAEQGLADNLTSIDEAVDYARRLGPLLANVADVRVNPETPQAAMFHLHIDRDPAVLVQAATGYAQQHGIVVLPIPRATEKGRSVCEISVGRRTMEHPPEFWQQHLRDCLTTS